MHNIQLQKIIDLQGLDSSKLAQELFKGHKHPSMALSRVLTGKMLLNANQVAQLAELTGLPIGFIYAAGEWRGSATDKKLFFSCGEVTAERDALTLKTKLSYFHKGQPYIETLVHPSNMPAKLYLSELTEIVIKNSKNNK
jgi:hypothetical protein